MDGPSVEAGAVAFKAPVREPLVSATTPPPAHTETSIAFFPNTTAKSETPAVLNPPAITENPHISSDQDQNPSPETPSPSVKDPSGSENLSSPATDPNRSAEGLWNKPVNVGVDRPPEYLSTPPPENPIAEALNAAVDGNTDNLQKVMEQHLTKENSSRLAEEISQMEKQAIAGGNTELYNKLHQYSEIVSRLPSANPLSETATAPSATFPQVETEAPPSPQPEKTPQETLLLPANVPSAPENPPAPVTSLNQKPDSTPVSDFAQSEKIPPEMITVIPAGEAFPPLTEDASPQTQTENPSPETPSPSVKGSSGTENVSSPATDPNQPEISTPISPNAPRSLAEGLFNNPVTVGVDPHPVIPAAETPFETPPGPSDENSARSPQESAPSQSSNQEINNQPPETEKPQENIKDTENPIPQALEQLLNENDKTKLQAVMEQFLTQENSVQLRQTLEQIEAEETANIIQSLILAIINMLQVLQAAAANDPAMRQQALDAMIDNSSLAGSHLKVLDRAAKISQIMTGLKSTPAVPDIPAGAEILNGLPSTSESNPVETPGPEPPATEHAGEEVLSPNQLPPVPETAAAVPEIPTPPPPTDETSQVENKPPAEIPPASETVAVVPPAPPESGETNIDDKPAEVPVTTETVTAPPPESETSQTPTEEISPPQPEETPAPENPAIVPAPAAEQTPTESVPSTETESEAVRQFNAIAAQGITQNWATAPAPAPIPVSSPSVSVP